MTDSTDSTMASNLTDRSDAAPVGTEAAHETAPAPSDAPDLAAIERDLTAVEVALSALDDGSYWLDEATGEPIPDDVLAANPVARRA